MNTSDRNVLTHRLQSTLGASARKSLQIHGFNRAGVLVPLVWMKTEYELLFTKRTETVETHKGQISFPGGMVSGDDGDIVQTALRETEEELGITQQEIRVLGILDDFPTPSGFVITPVVGMMAALPTMTPNAEEVADVFSVPLAFFVDPKSGRSEMRELRGTSHEVWFYEYGPHTIWGATAMIIRSLLEKLTLP